MSSRMHEMYQLLQECGEDASCGCGCSGKELDETPPKKKKVKEGLEGAANVMSALEEARRKIGLRQFRRVRQVKSMTKGTMPKVRAAIKMKQPMRRGAVNNRHRR